MREMTKKTEMTLKVAEMTGHCADQWAIHYEQGNYSVWQVRIIIDDEGAHLAGVRLINENVANPTKRQLENRALLHSMNLI